jgi:hypothetical protein
VLVGEVKLLSVDCETQSRQGPQLFLVAAVAFLISVLAL